MEDKDFLGYFNKLGPPASLDQVKLAAGKIVNTLVAITQTGAQKSASTDQAHEQAEKAIKSKYSTGDLGEKVFVISRAWLTARKKSKLSKRADLTSNKSCNTSFIEPCRPES